MKMFTPSLTALLLLVLTAGTALAMDSIDQLKVGKMSLSFSPRNGFSLEYAGASVIKESTLYVVKPGWLAVYYAYSKGDKNITVEDIQGGKLAVIQHKTPSFEAEHRITMLENQITFELRYKLLEDVSDAGIECNLGYISAPLITGCAYQAETENGLESGIIPLKPLSTGWDGFVTKNRFRKLALDSRIGRIHVETSGEPSSMSLVDVRGLRVTWAEKSPIFTLGLPRTLLKKDREGFTSTTFRFEPLGKRSQPAVPINRIDVPVKEVSDLHKTAPGPVVVIPEPQDMKLLDGDFILTDRTRIVVGEKAREEDLRGARSFAAEVRSLYRIRLPIVRESKADSGSLILVGEAALNNMAAEAAKVEGMNAPGKEEGYALKVTPERVIVLGHDQRGSYYGMQTLKQLVKVSANAISLQGCNIADYPSLAFRGVYMYTGNKALPFHKKLIDRIVSRYKMNHLILNVDQIQWKCAPEIAPPFAMSQEDIKKDIDYAKEHFLEVTPQVSSLGHMHWIFYKGQNLHLAEDPEHPYAYCPSRQESYDFILRIYDEAVELFDHPKYIHIGHDEVTSVTARFPYDEVCKKKSVGELFIEDTLRIYNHLKKKGINVMMWGDMLLAPGESPDACNMPDAGEADRLRKLVPKDVTITDWHYAVGSPDAFRSLKLFQDEGLKCIASTWYTSVNIQNFSQAAKDNNSLGLLQTTWAGFDSNENNLVADREQFTAYVLAAEYAWNSGKTSLDKLPYQADEAFFNQWDRTPPVRRSLAGFTVDLGAFYNVSLANNARETNWIGTGPNSDLSSAPTGTTRLKDNLFSLGGSTNEYSAIRLSGALDAGGGYPEKVVIPIGRKAESLVFLHTCVWADTPDRKVGAYRINYEDGTSDTVDLIYNKNIAAWTDKSTTPDAVVVWRNKTRDGQDISLREFVWENPHPERIIRSLELNSDTTDAGPVILGISGISE